MYFPIVISIQHMERGSQHHECCVNMIGSHETVSNFSRDFECYSKHHTSVRASSVIAHERLLNNTAEE